MDKKIQKVAITSMVTLFSTTVLSAITTQPSTVIGNGIFARAEEPPIDEEVPDVTEKSLVNEVRKKLKEIQEFINEDDYELAREIFEEINREAVANIPNVEKKFPGILAEIDRMAELLKPKENGSDSGPTSSVRKEKIVITTTYREDLTLEAGKQEVEFAGEEGEKTYTMTNGVEDSGVITKEMKPKRVKVGTKPKVNEEPIPAPPAIEKEDSELEVGVRVLEKEAQPGKRIITTKYILNSATGKVTEDSPTVEEQQGSPAIYRVGTKPVVTPPKMTTRTEPIAIKTIYTEDAAAEAGQKTVLSQGEEGVLTYTSVDGKEDAGVVTKAMQPKRIKVGTKPKVVTEIIPAPADILEEDATLEEGVRELKQPAVAGKKITTTTYRLNLATGEVSANQPSVEEVTGKAAVYRIGTKKVEVPPVVTTRTEPIPIKTTYIADQTMAANQQNVEFEGVVGEKTYTTTNGVEDSGVVTKVMQPRRIKVGTKPTVTTEVIPAPADIEENDATLEEGKRLLKTPAVDGVRKTTTTYQLDGKTGKAIANQPVVEEVLGTPAVYRVGTKKVEVPPVVTTRTEVIAVTTEYIADDTAVANTQTVVFEGAVGEKTYTTTNGVEDSGVVTKVMQPRRIKVGTKPTVTTEVIPAPADIEENDVTLEEGKRLLKTPAVDGTRTTTTTYTLNTKTGEVTANKPSVKEVAGKSAVYRVGTKKADGSQTPPVISTRTEAVSITTEYIADETMAASTQVVEFEGVVGEKTYTTTNGVEDSGVVTKVMQPRRIKVGTKPTVITEVIPAPAEVERNDDTLEEGNRVLETPAINGTRTTTTTYTLNVQTGEVIANESSVKEIVGKAAVYRVGTKKVSDKEGDTGQSNPPKQQLQTERSKDEVSTRNRTADQEQMLPKTGETRSNLSVWGAAIIASVLALIPFRKREEK